MWQGTSLPVCMGTIQIGKVLNGTRAHDDVIFLLRREEEERVTS